MGREKFETFSAVVLATVSAKKANGSGTFRDMRGSVTKGSTKEGGIVRSFEKQTAAFTLPSLSLSLVMVNSSFGEDETRKLLKTWRAQRKTEAPAQA